MWNSLALASLLLLAPAEVTIESLDGSRTTGQLISLSGDILTVESSDGPVEIPFQQLLTVQPITPPDPLPAEASSWIELLDGSLLEATAVEIKEGTLEATIRSGARVSIKTRNIRHTRLVELGAGRR